MRYTKTLCLCVVTLLGIVSQQVVAQQAVIEEAIVTATKREASIRDVPIAISAFSGEDLQARGITDVNSLNPVLPGFFG